MALGLATVSSHAINHYIIIVPAITETQEMRVSWGASWKTEEGACAAASTCLFRLMMSTHTYHAALGQQRLLTPTQKMTLLIEHEVITHITLNT